MAAARTVDGSISVNQVISSSSVATLVAERREHAGGRGGDEDVLRESEVVVGEHDDGVFGAAEVSSSYANVAT